jgi:hypothetical protein
MHGYPVTFFLGEFPNMVGLNKIKEYPPLNLEDLELRSKVLSLACPRISRARIDI